MTVLSIIISGLVAIFGGAVIYGILQGLHEVRTERNAVRLAEAEKQERQRIAQEKIVDFLEKRQALAQPGVAVEVTDEVSCVVTESRVGGTPAWPVGQPYPKPKGKFPLCFLAQINLADMPEMEGFPKIGLLQFYFAADDLYGMTFPESKDGKKAPASDILVIYHSSTDNMQLWQQFVSEDQVIELEVPFRYHDWWWKGFKISFGPVKLYQPTFRDYRIQDDYWNLEKFFRTSEAFYEYTEKWDRHSPLGIIMGGHPHFTQSDPRFDYSELRAYSQVLISFPSIDGIFMWGDCGTGSFLIRPDQLKAVCFDDILYNYDCY